MVERLHINQLKHRSKWKKSSCNFEKGDVVLIKEPNMPPSKWAMGIIEEVHSGSDQIVRVVTVRTDETLKRRSVLALVLLLSDNDIVT